MCSPFNSDFHQNWAEMTVIGDPVSISNSMLIALTYNFTIKGLILQIDNLIWKIRSTSSAKLSHSSIKLSLSYFSVTFTPLIATFSLSCLILLLHTAKGDLLYCICYTCNLYTCILLKHDLTCRNNNNLSSFVLSFSLRLLTNPLFLRSGMKLTASCVTFLCCVNWISVSSFLANLWLPSLSPQLELTWDPTNRVTSS